MYHISEQGFRCFISVSRGSELYHISEQGPDISVSRGPDISVSRASDV